MSQSFSEIYGKWLETAPAFTFKEVEAILADVFEIAPEKRKAFVARLQQLQKLGLPVGSNVGRGKRVAYQGWQLCELLFYFDLIDAGVTPALLASRFGSGAFFTIDGAGRFGENAARANRSYFVHVRFNAIEHLTLATTDLSESHAVFNATSMGYCLDSLVGAAKGHPGVLIDIGYRFSALFKAVEKFASAVAGKDLFMHLSGETQDN